MTHEQTESSPFSDEALTETFYLSLSSDMDILATVNLPSSFKALVEVAIKGNNWLLECERLCMARTLLSPEG